MLSYTRLDHAQITTTLEELRDRIAHRFPESNLRRLCEQLLHVSREVASCAEYLERPNWAVRVAGGVAIVGLVALLGAVASITLRTPAQMGLSDLIQTIE